MTAGIAAGLGLSFTKPATAQPAPLPLRAWGKLPAVHHVALSPNGRRFAFVAEGEGGRLLNDYDAETGEARAIRMGGAPVTYVKWADDKFILAVTTINRHDGPGDYVWNMGGVLDLARSKQVQIFTDGYFEHPYINRNYHRITVDGSSRLTVPGFRRGTESSRIRFTGGLVGVSLESGRAFDIDIDGFPIIDWAVKPDGTVVGRSEFNESTKVWTLRYKGEKGWLPIYSVKEAIDFPTLCGLGRDGRSLLVAFNSGELADRYVEVSPEGKFSPPFDLAGFDNYPVFSQETYALAGFVTRRTIETCTLFDNRMISLPTKVAKALPNCRNYLVDFAADPSHVIIYSESEEDSGTYFYFNFGDGSYQVIGSPYPDVTMGAIARQTAFSYTASDGLEIPGFLTLPPSRDVKNLPLVVLPHDGFGGFDEEGFDWLAQAFASRGYAVLQPNYRGSGGNGYGLMAKGFGELGRRALDDLGDGVAHLAKAGIADPKRTAIVGRGLGGYLALASAALRPGAFRCAATISAVSDLKAYMKRRREDYGFDDDASGFLFDKRLLGDEQFWGEISPIDHVGAIDCPVLLVHPDDDIAVYPSQSRDMRKAMKAAGKSVQLVELKGEDQWLSHEATRIQALDAIVDFLMKNNPPS